MVVILKQSQGPSEFLLTMVLTWLVLWFHLNVKWLTLDIDVSNNLVGKAITEGDIIFQGNFHIFQRPF